MLQKVKEKNEKTTKNPSPIIGRKPTLKELEELFYQDEYPLKGKEPYQKM